MTPTADDVDMMLDHFTRTGTIDEDCGKSKKHKDGRSYDNKADKGTPSQDDVAETVEEAQSPSCWGCGDDWKSRWSANDLANTKKSSKFGGARMCPDCVGDPATGFQETDFAGPARRSSVGPKGQDVQIDLWRLQPTHHMCGNCGWSGQKSDATHCPNCKFGKLRTVDHTGQEIRESKSSVEALKSSHPNTYKHLLKRSREAEENTGDPAGEYGTLHSLMSEPPSKFRHALEHALVYHTATRLGPDMDYNLSKRLTAKVRKQVPDIVGAFERGELAQHVEPHLGRQSDTYRRGGDKYFESEVKESMRRRTHESEDMDADKPGAVCSECGRTVTHREYSSGQSSCCPDGSVIPEEHFGQSFDESVTPGYLPPPRNSSNALRPDGRLDIPFNAETPHAALQLQDFHRRLGSALPELHALTTATVTEERTALAMLFNELHTAHTDIGNVLSYSNQIPDHQMSALLAHYSTVVSEMLASLNPYLKPNTAVARGPYQLGGQLHDNVQDNVQEAAFNYDMFGSHDWSQGLRSGQRVRLNKPGHADHGKTGKVVRQQSLNFAVEFPHAPGKVQYFNSAELQST